MISELDVLPSSTRNLPFHGIPSVSCHFSPRTWCRLSGPLGGGMLPGGTWQGDLHRSADGESQIDDFRFSMSPCENKKLQKQKVSKSGTNHLRQSV